MNCPVVMETDHGQVVIELLPELAPQHVARIKLDENLKRAMG